MRVAAVIVAGGSGERFGRAGGKQLALVAGMPVLAWSVRAFDRSSAVDRIVVVCPDERVDEYRREAIAPLAPTTPVTFAPAAQTRQASVASGMAALDGAVDVIAVHDGARPLVTARLIDHLVAELGESEVQGVVPGHPSVDTLKSVMDAEVADTPDRGLFWAVQTPQVFCASTLQDAHARAMCDGFVGTDDASVVERYGGRVMVIDGPRDNIKVTLPEDLVVADAVLRSRAAVPAGRTNGMRIGIGYDVHAFAAQRRCVIGGVDIPHALGLAGHSDADVLTHAVCDAILGAMRAGDIGKLFPDTDPAYSNADSLRLLSHVSSLAQESGWRIDDVDCVLVLEEPKIAPYREHMRRNLAEAMGIHVDSVGVKATTTEGLGFEGRGEGVAAHAIALLTRR